MNKQELLNNYTKNYTEEEFFKNNVTYAFSQIQLEEAMEKLGAKDKTELTSIFGYGDICLKSKVFLNLLKNMDRNEKLRKLVDNIMFIFHGLMDGNINCTFNRLHC